MGWQTPNDALDLRRNDFLIIQRIRQSQDVSDFLSLRFSWFWNRQRGQWQSTSHNICNSHILVSFIYLATKQQLCSSSWSRGAQLQFWRSQHSSVVCQLKRNQKCETPQQIEPDVSWILQNMWAGKSLNCAGQWPFRTTVIPPPCWGCAPLCTFKQPELTI